MQRKKPSSGLEPETPSLPWRFGLSTMRGRFAFIERFRPQIQSFSREAIPCPARLESPREAPNLSPKSVPKMAFIYGDGVCAIPSLGFATRVGTS